MNSNNVKELAFVTITMRDLDSTDTSKADFEVQMTNVDTAGVKTVKFDFKPDPRLGRKDFPINRDRAEGLVVHAMEELIQTLPAEVREKHETHFMTSDVFDRLLATASTKLKDFSLLPNPIETPFGKIEFVAKPNRENFTSLKGLPNMAFSVMRKSTSDVLAVYLSLTPAKEMPMMSDGTHLGWGVSQAMQEGRPIIDRSQALMKIASQLDEALAPYDLEVVPESVPMRRFDGSTPQVEINRRELVRQTCCQLADNIIQRMHDVDSGHDAPDFTLGKGGRHRRIEDADHSLTMTLHLGGDYVFHVLSGEYLKKERGPRNVYAPVGRGDVFGSVNFHGEKRGFSICYSAHHRYATPFNLKELMDPPKLLAVISKAVEEHLQPLNLAQFIDTSSIQFDQEDVDATAPARRY